MGNPSIRTPAACEISEFQKAAVALAEAVLGLARSDGAELPFRALLSDLRGVSGLSGFVPSETDPQWI